MWREKKGHTQGPVCCNLNVYARNISEQEGDIILVASLHKLKQLCQHLIYPQACGQDPVLTHS